MDESQSGPEVVDDRFRVAIQAHGEKVVDWRKTGKGGNRDDRMMRQVTVSLPPKISDFEPVLPPEIGAQADRAIASIVRLDSGHGQTLGVLSVLLLRAESVASSKIENVEATMEDFAKATHGVKANSSATSMVASANALDSLILSVNDHGDVLLENVLAAHRILMADDPHESRYAGRLRDMQNWIGGSDFAPRNALYVPPPADTVQGYLEDLLIFVNRDDVPVLVQAAVAHAQFESIHPFTDGNGRIGRALINAILRRRGVTEQVVVPLASALVAKREAYFEVLSAYREGDAGPIVRAFAHASQTSARESVLTATRLAEMPAQWEAMYREEMGRAPRVGSAASKILGQLLAVPFFTSEEIEDSIGGSESAIYSGIEKLAQAGVLRPLTNRKRRQVWCAGLLIDELEDLGQRIAYQTVSDPTWREIQLQVTSSHLRQLSASLASVQKAISHANLTGAMRLSVSAAMASEAVRIQLAESLRISDSIRAHYANLIMSSDLREAFEIVGKSSSVILTGQTLKVTETIREGLGQWAELSEKLARSVRLPESVAQSLRDGVSQSRETLPSESDNVTGLEETEDSKEVDGSNEPDTRL
ncbi:Fic family protein [Jonesiaceae bacterium BS-20]|uniref:Fic family protein n=1 Tax=Jonesiaceae bacterium BS-20 TaxID=3120821 RepID=A0AAU7DU34_9MICO